MSSAPLHTGPPPSAMLLAMEFRAPWEFALVLPAWPLLHRAPAADGHSVVVFPGLAASDSSTAPLRRYLSHRGLNVQGWKQGVNFGPRPGVIGLAARQVIRCHEDSGRRVSLIGWSLGGIYARELAKTMPDRVRCVITLGTPFAGHHRSTHAWRIYQMTSGHDIEREAKALDLPGAPPVPTTSIYSKSDGIVAWQGSIQSPASHNPQTENIEVLASHVGLGLNPSAWWAVLDRLAQPEGQWRPFVAPRMAGLGKLLYPKAHKT